MRILQAISGVEYGGAERFFVKLVVALKRAGMDQQVLLAPTPMRAAELTEHGLDVKQIFGTPGGLHVKFRFLKAVADYQPDIVMTWMADATYFCPSYESSSGLKKFVHVSRLGGYYNLNYFKACDYLVGNTPHLVQYFRDNGWSEERTKYIPNFTNLPNPSSRAIDRARYQTPDGVPLAVALGRFHEDKAFDTLIRAVKLVPQMHLWIAGDDGETKSEIEEMVRTLDLTERVRILEWQDDITALFRSADLFVCPSRSETLGNVILEAWAHEVPVVATAAQGPVQLIVDGINGVLVPVDNADELASAMKRVSDDKNLSRSLAQAGLETLHSRFAETAVVKSYLEFFESIVRKSSVCV
jgi:Glycosyltransferase